MTSIAGIDVGGTKCLGVLVDGSEVLREVRRPTPPIESLVDTLIEITAELGEFATLGIGVPGLISSAGVIRSSPNLPRAVEFDLKTAAQIALGREVAIENDATCATLAEWKLGSGAGTSDMWLVTLGTGIGGGLVSGSVLQRGRQGFAGEIGHMIVDIDGILCPCGKRGCWERYASGSGLMEISGGESGEIVFAKGREGDNKALADLDQLAKWIAVGVSNLTNATDPDVVVLGGGMASSLGLIMPRVEYWLGQFLYGHENRRLPKLLVASLAERAGAIGAAIIGSGG